ncbi:MAG TPA: FtsQ-type POTRA domain-containing protein, partial [Pyrinomonadaceae bacterium]|nr:FtsQ-type POTRA domain-containing protein [Pyrinomonadaceae bacterium]
MARQKSTTKRKTASASKARRKSAARGSKSSGNFVNFFVPLFFIVCIVFCLGFLFLMGYRTVTASAFFDVRKVEVQGTNRVSTAEVEKIVRSETEKSGVWKADLGEIRGNVEQLGFVKTATVSRVLPDGVRVNVVERQPVAVVRIEGGDFWADEDGVILTAVGKTEMRPPFVLQGWERDKTENAAKNNRERVKLYLQMLEEWREFELAKRVVAVDLSDLQEPEAIVVDSGEPVKVVLGKENYA